MSYINISGTFYYLCSILDGGSRYIVNWDLRESMTEADIEVMVQRAKELHPQGNPGSSPTTGRSSLPETSTNSFRIAGMTQVRTSPYYPQSNG